MGVAKRLAGRRQVEDFDAGRVEVVDGGVVVSPNEEVDNMSLLDEGDLHDDENLNKKENNINMLLHVLGF